jgi:hypothetical protein
VTIPLPARAWLALLAIDTVAFALLITGIATGVSLVTAAGAALVVATSVAAVLLRTRAGRPS